MDWWAIFNAILKFCFLPVSKNKSALKLTHVIPGFNNSDLGLLLAPTCSFLWLSCLHIHESSLQRPGETYHRQNHTPRAINEWGVGQFCNFSAVFRTFIPVPVASPNSYYIVLSWLGSRVTPSYKMTFEIWKKTIIEVACFWWGRAGCSLLFGDIWSCVQPSPATSSTKEAELLGQSDSSSYLTWARKGKSVSSFKPQVLFSLQELPRWEYLMGHIFWIMSSKKAEPPATERKKAIGAETIRLNARRNMAKQWVCRVRSIH